MTRQLQALGLLVLMGGASVGWVWADDRPRAGAAWSMALGAALCQLLRMQKRADRWLALICAYGVGYHISALACVVWYPVLSSKEVGVCEEATGLPIGALLCAGLLFVASEAFNGGDRS